MQSPIRPENQGPLQQGNHQMMQPQPMPKTHSGKRFSIRKPSGMKALLVLVAVLQIIMIILIINPTTLLQQFQNQQVINAVAAQTTVNTTEAPVVATVTDANALRTQNAAQAQVYKDAQNGDYVLGFSDKMIIYRKDGNKIIYNGPNPNDLVTQTQQKIIDDISAAAIKQGLLPSDSTETPQISIITDIKSLQATNPTFYSVARNNDIVALYPNAQVIILYNQDSATIVNSGKYSTNITAL